MAAWTFEAIGTAWQIDTREPLSPEVQVAVLGVVERFDQTWSRFRDDSLVADLARAAGTRTVPEDDGPLLDLYDQLAEVTDGAVNPLVGRGLADLGYDADYSLTPSAPPAPAPPWSSLRHGGATVTTSEPVTIDVGAAGKGRLVDAVADLVPTATTIDASGDLLHLGPDPLRVALEHPADPSRAIGVVELRPGDALCGSATNRRAWGHGLHHVLDARDGRPTADVVATWVVTRESCMLADGLATAHFFAAPDRLLDRWDHEFVRIHADGQVLRSSGLRGEVFA